MIIKWNIEARYMTDMKYFLFLHLYYLKMNTLKKFSDKSITFQQQFV